MLVVARQVATEEEEDECNRLAYRGHGSDLALVGNDGGGPSVGGLQGQL
jgi:hypothetical protein